MAGANKKFTLVIDPGHGGKDAGAPGTFSVEKNINLNALAYRHRTYEVETHKSAGDAEDNARRHTLHAPHAVEVEAEQRRAAHEDIREARSRDRCREDRQQRRHAQVDHQHFECEHQPMWSASIPT